MISNLNILFDLKDVSKDNIPVNLPNGASVAVKYIGKYFLNSSIDFEKGSIYARF